MTKKDKIETLMLISALEAFCIAKNMLYETQTRLTPNI